MCLADSFNRIRTSENAFDSISPAARVLKKRAMDVLGITPYDEDMTDGLQVHKLISTFTFQFDMCVNVTPSSSSVPRGGCIWNRLEASR